MDPSHIPQYNLILNTAQLLISIALVVAGYFIRRLDGDMKKLESKVEAIEKDLVSYERNVAVGNSALQALRDLIEGHVEREEKETWGKLDQIAANVVGIQLENEKAHGDLRERIVKLERNGRTYKAVRK